jgi:hypothetical protein
MIPEAACIGDAGHDCDLHSRHIKTSCAKAALWEAAGRRVPTEKQMVVLPARTLRTTASAGLESSVASPDQPKPQRRWNTAAVANCPAYSLRPTIGREPLKTQVTRLHKAVTRNERLRQREVTALAFSDSFRAVSGLAGEGAAGKRSRVMGWATRLRRQRVVRFNRTREWRP